MSWVITPTFVAENLEARNWVQRAVANGGSVSVSTQIAVSNFCNEIDNASGLRGAITRLNLFCGDNLSAALVPLYLAESFGAAAKGNTTDTNNNFVSGDYNATGTNGGLGKASNTNAYLNTGLAWSAVGSAFSGHLSASGKNLETSGDTMFLGVYDAGVSATGSINTLDICTAYLTGTDDRAYRNNDTVSGGGAPAIPQTSLTTSESHLLGTRTANNSASLYRNGTSVSTKTGTVTSNVNTRPFFVFALNNTGTPGNYTSARLRMYSIGSGITASQAAAFATAVANFNTALGRT